MSQSLQATRTRGLIRQAFLDLVDEKGFAEVTVSDIATRAMINRATFYRYFRDKHHLAEHIFVEIVAEVLFDMDSAGADLPGRVRSWTRFFERIGANAKLFRPLLGRRGDPAFTARLRDLCLRIARERLRAGTHLPVRAPARRGPAEHKPSAVPEDLVLVLAANHIVATLSWWLEDGRRHTPEQMANTIVEFFSHGYFRVLGLHDVPRADHN